MGCHIARQTSAPLCARTPTRMDAESRTDKPGEVGTVHGRAEAAVGSRRRRSNLPVATTLSAKHPGGLRSSRLWKGARRQLVACPVARSCFQLIHRCKSGPGGTFAKCGITLYKCRIQTVPKGSLAAVKEDAGQPSVRNLRIYRFWVRSTPGEYPTRSTVWAARQCCL